MRPSRALLALACLACLASCGSDVDGFAMSIKDPLALIDDVDELRLYVLPADPYTCDATTGMVSPEVERLPEGMLLDAIVDVSLDVSGSRAMTELEVPSGAYTVLVRGTGTDMVTGIPDSVIALACSGTTIEAGETREVRLTLIPQIGMGVCGDGVFSPDEQCEDGNVADGDGCSATCRTEPFAINTTTAGTQNNPSAGGAVGQRWVFTYDSDATTSLIRYLEPDRTAVTSPGVLMNDATFVDAFPSGAAFALQSSVAVASTGRVAVAFTTFTAGPDVKVGFFDQNRTAEGPPAMVHDGAGGDMAGNPAVAFAGNGAVMVVFENPASATGLSGAVFAAGSATPAGAAFEVGTGATGGRNPAIAGASDHFVVAFAAGGVAYVQRFGADGAPRDASAQPADGGTMQDQAAVGALADGRALVAWRQAGGAGDGAGTAVRARAFAADGTAAGDAFVLNTTTAGDQGAPSIVAAPGAAPEDTRFFVAFANGAGIRARAIDGDGDPALNHEQPPTTGDWEVAAAGAMPATAYGGPTGDSRRMTVWSEGGDIRGRVFPVP